MLNPNFFLAEADKHPLQVGDNTPAFSLQDNNNKEKIVSEKDSYLLFFSFSDSELMTDYLKAISPVIKNLSNLNPIIISPLQVGENAAIGEQFGITCPILEDMSSQQVSRTFCNNAPGGARAFLVKEGKITQKLEGEAFNPSGFAEMLQSLQVSNTPQEVVPAKSKVSKASVKTQEKG